MKVVDSAGNPLQGISITFQGPTSGASGAFATSATVLTNQNGIATAPIFTANAVAGSFNVSASLTSPVAGVSRVKFSLKIVAPPSHGLLGRLLALALPFSEWWVWPAIVLHTEPEYASEYTYKSSWSEVK